MAYKALHNGALLALWCPIPLSLSLTPLQPHWPILMFNENAKHSPTPGPLLLLYFCPEYLNPTHCFLACSLTCLQGSLQRSPYQRSCLWPLYRKQQLPTGHSVSITLHFSSQLLLPSAMIILCFYLFTVYFSPSRMQTPWWQKLCLFIYC